MATQAHDPLEIDRTNTGTAVIGLFVWLAITLAVVALLMLSGDVLVSVFV